MFCPNCGQQQIADSPKYCPRCGTQLAGLAEWLAGGLPYAATFAQPPAAPAAPAAPSPRRRGMRRGAKVMFLSGVLMPFMIGLSLAFGEPVPILFALIIFFLGLSLTVYARLFSEGSPPAPPRPAPPQVHGATPSALPPAAENPLNNFSRRGVRTAELSQPPSVTENTTRLLGDE